MYTRKTRVLLIGEAATLCHVARPAVLARALPPEEFDVFFASSPRYMSLLPELSGAWLPIRSSGAERVLDHARRGRPLFDQSTLEEYVAEDLRLFREVSPHIVVGDMRHSLTVSCAMAHLPFVNIVNAQWSPLSDLAVEPVDHPLEHVIGPELTRMVARLGWPLGSAASCMPLNLVRLKHGLPPLTLDLKQMISAGDYVVHPDVPELVPLKWLPVNHRYLGPVLWVPSVELPAWWGEIPEDRPIVYVNLGSSGGELSPVLEALADLPVSVITATVGRSQLGTVPPNVFVADYLPADQCVRRARLTISNGGTMSVQQSLAEGVPVLGLVTHADQLASSRAVCAAGAGEWLTAGRADAASVVRLVQRLLSRDSYHLAAARMARIFATYDPAARFRGLLREIAP